MLAGEAHASHAESGAGAAPGVTTGMRPILGGRGEGHAWTKARSTLGIVGLMAQLKRFHKFH